MLKLSIVLVLLLAPISYSHAYVWLRSDMSEYEKDVARTLNQAEMERMDAED